MTVYAPPGTEGSVVSYEARYDNWIGGKRVAPVKGQYFENVSPVNGKPFCEVARSTAEDIELALDAARRRPRLGQDVGRRALGHPHQDRPAHGGEPRGDRRGRELGKRQAGPGDPGRGHPAGDRPLRTSPACCAGRRARSPNSTTTRSPTTSTSRSVWSGRSSRGTSRS